jgi:hypothetical protein
MGTQNGSERRFSYLLLAEALFSTKRNVPEIKLLICPEPVWAIMDLLLRFFARHVAKV